MDSAQKQAVIAQYAKHEGDTGSAEVQIALLTARINGLADHFKANKKDFHSAPACSSWSASVARC